MVVAERLLTRKDKDDKLIQVKNKVETIRFSPYMTTSY